MGYRATARPGTPAALAQMDQSIQRDGGCAPTRQSSLPGAIGSVQGAGRLVQGGARHGRASAGLVAAAGGRARRSIEVGGAHRSHTYGLTPIPASGRAAHGRVALALVEDALASGGIASARGRRITAAVDHVALNRVQGSTDGHGARGFTAGARACAARAAYNRGSAGRVRGAGHGSRASDAGVASNPGVTTDGGITSHT